MLHGDFLLIFSRDLQVSFFIWVIWFKWIDDERIFFLEFYILTIEKESVFELSLCIFINKVIFSLCWTHSVYRELWVYILGTHIPWEDVFSADLSIAKSLPSIEHLWYSRRRSLNLVTTSLLSKISIYQFFIIIYIFNTFIICSWSNFIVWRDKLCIFELFNRLSLIDSSLSLKQVQIWTSLEPCIIKKTTASMKSNI